MVEKNGGGALVVGARGAMAVAVGALVVAISMRCVGSGGGVASRRSFLLILFAANTAARFSASGRATEFEKASGRSAGSDVSDASCIMRDRIDVNRF